MPNLATELAKELREAKLQGYPQELMPDLCDRVANLLEHLSDTVRITNGALDLVTKQRDEAERLSRERDTGVPEGWQLVPIKMTNEMFFAWVDHERLHNRGYSEYRYDAYRAMLSAAPQPPTDYDCAADCPCKE